MSELTFLLVLCWYETDRLKPGWNDEYGWELNTRAVSLAFGNLPRSCLGVSVVLRIPSMYQRETAIRDEEQRTNFSDARRGSRGVVQLVLFHRPFQRVH